MISREDSQPFSNLKNLEQLKRGGSTTCIIVVIVVERFRGLHGTFLQRHQSHQRETRRETARAPPVLFQGPTASAMNSQIWNLFLSLSNTRRDVLQENETKP